MSMKSLPTCLLVAGFLISASSVLADGKEPPVPVRTVAPEYPAYQQRAGVSGLVTVRCTIDTHGDVVGTEVVKVSDPAFERPAIAALQKWKFKPGTLDGVAIATKAIIPVKFVAAN